ncbi:MULTISPECIES: SCP2 sterol-binding domain-containing protein [unclassified Amycolatopsis]|uniref:SCP2 sterol-binding domain-containing protein n=1 Tax=unclassified Amycolatopsis TaxID=2618356 RepID=UPI002875FCB8|nr:MULTISPECIES: SCP2 sterol-binding domain-containing protein [unclassified Amycolatopsis]MDS0134141.1 SCP2 sterol-binding domain-containing protein [Amycolatopsis sp. 505]MDS0145017.1 SCP2 sterol-binding domain-containing protein [Amycolatopsis sp. CM201R]
MAENAGMTSADRIADLRGTALLDALERLDPLGPEAHALDVNTLVEALDPAELRKDDFRRFLKVLLTLASRAPAFDLSKVEPARFASLVASASRAQLESVVADRSLRERVLDEIFARMGAHIRPDRARDVQAVVHWRLSGGAGEGGFDRYETTIAHGSCTVSRSMHATPRVTITIAPADFFRLITHQATPAVLFVTGRIKVKGDLAFAAGLIGFFDLPKPV